VLLRFSGGWGIFRGGAFLELNGLKLPCFGRFWYFLVCLVFFLRVYFGGFEHISGYFYAAAFRKIWHILTFFLFFV